MPSSSQLRVLFTGYAPVHFVCFRPLYRRLLEMPNVEVFLSGGLRSKTEAGLTHDENALYAPFGIDPDAIVPTGNLGDLAFDILFAANTKMIAPARVDARVQIFHGISFRNKAVRPENMNADYYFMVGPYMKRRFVESGLMADDDPRALSIGFMKTDRLLNGDLDRSALLAEYGFDGSRPVVLYAPTGQKDNSLETMGEAVIEKIVEQDKYDLIVKPHDHPKRTKVNWFKRLAGFAGPHTKIARELDVIPLLFMSDLLMTDASSVSSEYALLDRPIVFLDVPQLLKRAGKSDHSQLDLDSWGRHTGVVVETADEVTAAIDESLAGPGQFAPQRQAMAKDLFYNPGQSMHQAVNWLTSAFLQQGAHPRVARSETNGHRGRPIAAPRICFNKSNTHNGKEVAVPCQVSDPTGKVK